MTSSSEQTTALPTPNPYIADTRAVMHPGLAHQFGEGFLPALLPWLAMAWDNGHRADRPHVVSTVAELDALPHGTVLHGAQGQAYLILSGGIYGAGNPNRMPAGFVSLPATVLWVGGTE